MSNYRIFKLCILLSIILNSCQVESQDQPYAIERYILDSLDADYGYFLAVKPKSDEISGALFLMPGLGQRAEDVFRDSDLPQFAFENGLLTIAYTTHMRMVADSFMQSRISEVLTKAKSLYDLDLNKLVLGGFSAGGRIVLRYTELCKQFPEKYPAAPAGVFLVDAPVDIFHSWELMQALKSAARSQVSVAEAEGVENLYRQFYGTTPGENPNGIYPLQPFLTRWKIWCQRTVPGKSSRQSLS